MPADQAVLFRHYAADLSSCQIVVRITNMDQNQAAAVELVRLPHPASLRFVIDHLYIGRFYIRAIMKSFALPLPIEGGARFLWWQVQTSYVDAPSK
eukprot:SAG31_NODE_307_length_17957_cov_5.236645_5_plen_96_part_00